MLRRKGILISLVLFFVLVVYPATVQADGGKDGDLAIGRIRGACSWLRQRIKGSIEYRVFNHFHGAPQEAARFKNEGVLNLDIGYDWEQVGIDLVPEIRFDNRDLSAGVIDKFDERNRKRFIGNIKEGYATYYGGDLTISLGKKIYSWGKADGYNPTDSINPYDFLDVPVIEKIGVFSTALSYSFGDSFFDLVLVPLFTPSRLPGTRNRWAGNPGQRQPPEQQPLLQGGQFNTTAFALRDREIPPRQWENLQFALRCSTTKRGWDVSLSYYEGFDSVAVIREDTVDGETRYTPVFSRIRKIGTGFSTTFGEAELHGEFAYRVTITDRDDDFMQYVLGGNYTWYELPIVSKYMEEITLVLEYAGEGVTKMKRDPNIIGSAGYTRPFTNSTLAKFIFKFSEETQIEVGGAVNMDDGDYILQPKCVHKITDNLKLETGLDFLDGQDNSFFGKWTKNDRAFTFLTYLF